MKQSAMITLCVLTILQASQGLAWAGEPLRSCVAPPFETGEMAKFEVRIGPLKVGEGTAMWEETFTLPDGVAPQANLADHPMWRARGRGISTGLVAAFYEVDDGLDSWMSAGTFLPRFQELRVHETNERALRRITFDHREGVSWFWRDRTYYRRRPDKVKITERQNPLVPGSLGPVSLFMALRCQRAAVDDTYEVSVHEDGKNLTVTVHVEAIETLETIWGEREALRARVRVFHEGKAKFKRPFWAWVTADERRIPLRFVTDLPFANLKGKMVGYRRNFTAKVEGELDPTFLED